MIEKFNISHMSFNCSTAEALSISCSSQELLATLRSDQVKPVTVVVGETLAMGVHRFAAVFLEKLLLHSHRLCWPTCSCKLDQLERELIRVIIHSQQRHLHFPSERSDPDSVDSVVEEVPIRDPYFLDFHSHPILILLA